jgi:actin-related protein
VAGLAGGDWAKMAEIMMEKFEVPALYLANKSVMALYGGGQMTGIYLPPGAAPAPVTCTF